MRAAISVLITSLVFGSLAVNCQMMPNRLSGLLSSSDNSQLLLSAKPTKTKGRTNQPELPIPYRGSGRRELIEYVATTYPA